VQHVSVATWASNGAENRKAARENIKRLDMKLILRFKPKTLE